MRATRPTPRPTQPASLRTRLLVLTLLPLTLISLLVGFWRISAASQTASEVFDRNLTVLTLAIAKDVAVSGGDALSEFTNLLIKETFPERVYYHVRGPDGVFISGYATPPIKPVGVTVAKEKLGLFESNYRGENVRAAQLIEFTEYEAVSGYTVVTVWQSLSARDALTRQLSQRAMILILSLYLTVAAVLWFGIKQGLKPLTDLQAAISIRSSDDLSRIRRAVPVEASRIVATLNALFAQVNATIASRDRFISDAAHQLRNPVAGILSLAEAARDAQSSADRVDRVEELVVAARHASRLTTQLLMLERAKGQKDKVHFERLDLNDIAREVGERNAARVLAQNIEFDFQPWAEPVQVMAEEVLLQEAVQNLLDNALSHAGSGNSLIGICVRVQDNDAVVSVHDQGVGIDQSDSETVFARFAQLRPGEGSGLGLSIVDEIARLHNGRARIEDSVQGATVSIVLDRVTAIRDHYSSQE